MLRLALIALVPFALVACAERPAEPPPSTTPPAAAQGIPAPSAAAPAQPGAVKSAMWSMAAKTNRLAQLLNAPPPLAPEGLTEARAIVDDVAKIAAGLAVDPQAQKHPLVRSGLADFTRSITLAQAGLAKDPADLAPAAALGASCQQCHAQGKSAPPFEL